MTHEFISVASAFGIGRAGRLAALAATVFALSAPEAGAAAQEGTITYIRAVRLDLELPPALAALKGDVPKAAAGVRVLHFAPAGSLMTLAAQSPGDPAAGARAAIKKGASDVAVGKALGAAAFSESPWDAADLQAVYEDYASGAMVETRVFLGRRFRVSSQRPAYRWRITGERAMHLGRQVLRATTDHDGAAVEAWFTPEIPLPGGPAGYGGLPGMILVLSINDGQTQYQATEVALGPVEEGLIRALPEGQEVTPEEFDRIMADKIEEVKRLKPRGIG